MMSNDGEVVVTQRNGQLYLQSYDKADTGLLVAQPGILSISVLTTEVSDEVLGVEVLSRLEACREGITYDRGRWKNPRAIWEVAGVKNDRQLSRGAIFSSVSRENGVYQFSSVKTVRSGGFDEFNPPKFIEVGDAQLGADRIGKLLREALSKSEGVK